MHNQLVELTSVRNIQEKKGAVEVNNKGPRLYKSNKDFSSPSLQTKISSYWEGFFSFFLSFWKYGYPASSHMLCEMPL